MLEKTIKQILNKKVNKWLESIDSDEIKNAIRKDLVITGGCFTSMILNEEVNDYDCYFRTKETVLKVANYYADKWNEKHNDQENKVGVKTKLFVLDGANPSKELLEYYAIDDTEQSQSRMISNCPEDRIKMIFPSDGVAGDPKTVNSNEELGTDIGIITELDEVEAKEIEKQEKKDYFPVFISTNAITLSKGIQIVVRFYGEPEEIHDTYDFVHTKAYYTSREGEVVIPPDVYEYTINKTLKYTGSKYPVCSLFRLRKFIARGWRINAGQILKMCVQVSELDLMDIDVLEDQLVGVDSLYFMNLIEQFKVMKEKDPSFVLSSSYVLSVVDKIF